MRRDPITLRGLAMLALVPLALMAPIAVTVALGGCGSRGPLDDYATNVVADAGLEAEAAPPVDSGPDGSEKDAGREAGPLACGICVIQTCGSTILECLQSQECRAVFQCAASECLGGGGSGGGLNPTCLFQCAGDQPGGVAGALSIFLCLTNKCGGDCSSLLGGLGGFGGFGGSSSGGGSSSSSGGKGGIGASPELGARAPTTRNRAPSALIEFREIFSPWPELFTPVPAAH